MKKLAIFLAAMVLSLSLVACGGSNNSDSAGQSGGGSYQEGYDKGYRDGYQEAQKENGSNANGGAGSNTDSNGGNAVGDAMGGIGNAVGDAVAGAGDAVGDALGGNAATGQTTGTDGAARSAGARRSVDSGMTGRQADGSDSTFRRMLDNARVTDRDGFIK